MGNAKHAKKTRILVDEHDLSNYLNQIDTEGSAAPLNSTTFQDAEMTYAGGMADGKASLKGLYWSKADEIDPLDRDAIDDILSAALGADETNVVTLAHADVLTQGDRVTLLSARETKYSVTAPHDQLVSAMAEMQAIGGLRYGDILLALAARTVSGVSAVFDGGAASTLGAVLHLHCLLASAADTLDVIVEDSADGASGWATIAAFAQVTAKSAERLLIAGNVRRHLRVTYTIAGTGPSFTFLVALARNTY